MSLGWMKTILKLTAFSLIVGLVMAAFDVRPTEVFSAVGGAASDVFRRIISALQWAWRYIVLGAVVVVPLLANPLFVPVAAGLTNDSRADGNTTTGALH